MMQKCIFEHAVVFRFCQLKKRTKMLRRVITTASKQVFSKQRNYTKATEKMNVILNAQLAEIEQQGLYKRERVIASAQDAEITVSSKKVLNFCANNYLGLSNNSQLIDAAIETMKSHGLGMSSVRFICGTQVLLENTFCNIFNRTFTSNWKMPCPNSTRHKQPSCSLLPLMPMLVFLKPFCLNKMLLLVTL